MWLYDILSNFLLMSIQVSSLYFYFFALANAVVVKIIVMIFLRTHNFVSEGYIPRIQNVGS